MDDDSPSWTGAAMSQALPSQSAGTRLLIPDDNDDNASDGTSMPAEVPARRNRPLSHLSTQNRSNNPFSKADDLMGPFKRATDGNSYDMKSRESEPSTTGSKFSGSTQQHFSETATLPRRSSMKQPSMGSQGQIFEEREPSQSQPNAPIYLEDWKNMLNPDQTNVFSLLKNDQAIVEETLRLHQQQLHFARDEAELAACHATWEFQLEGEQASERKWLQTLQSNEAAQDNDQQQIESTMSSHLERVKQRERKFEAIQRAYRQLQLQLQREHHAREMFTLRMEQRAARHGRERQEQAAAGARRLRQTEGHMRALVSTIKDPVKQEALLQVHQEELAQVKVMQAKETDQMRETQLLQLRHSTKAFEYDQACQAAMNRLESTHLAEKQQLEEEQQLEVGQLRWRLRLDMHKFLQDQTKEAQRIPASMLQRRQRRAAQKLQAKLAKEARLREQQMRAQMEADFVEFLTVLHEKSDVSEGGKSSVSKSVSGSRSTVAFAALDHDDMFPSNKAAAELENEELETIEDVSKAMLERHAAEREAFETTHNSQVEALLEAHRKVTSAMSKKQEAALRQLKKSQQQGAANLRSEMEEEVKVLKTAHSEEKAQLAEVQQRSLDATRQTVVLRAQVARVTQEHAKNITDFLSFICHELRNPLCAMMGLMDMLSNMLLDADEAQQRVDTDEARKYLQIMTGQAKQMTWIINDVLDLGKIEDGKLQLEQSPLSIRTLLDEVAEAQRHFAASLRAPGSVAWPDSPGVGGSSNKWSYGSLEILVNVNEDVPDKVLGDEARIRQILTNLVSNAVKFTKEGAVTISVCLLSRGEGKVTLHCQVSDSGPGISPQDQSLLFGKFRQLAGMHRPSGSGGSGLGLCICKTLISRMGGNIGVHSKVGKGSDFWFVLPLGDPLHAGETTFSPPTPSSDSIPMNINPLPREGQRGSAIEELPPQVVRAGGSFLLYGDMTTAPNSPTAETMRSQEEDSELDEPTNSFGQPFEVLAPDKSSEDNSSTLMTIVQKPSEGVRTWVVSLPEGLDLRNSSAASWPASPNDSTGSIVTPGSSSQTHRPAAEMKSSKRRHLIKKLQDPLGDKRLVRKGADGSASNLRVLMAEDSPLLQMTTAAMMKRLGIVLEMASDGREALERCTTEAYDVVLMDVNMPVMTGKEATMRLREAGFKGKILACTANVMPVHVASYKACGFDEVLPKPYNATDLANVIKQVTNLDFELH